MTDALILRDVEVEGRTVDCLIRDGRVEQIGLALRVSGAGEIDGHGGALMPGLADHHLHLLAMGAAASSVDLTVVDDWPAALRAATTSRPMGWVRATGWDDERHGSLDRHRLDAVIVDRPVRVQHRSGALWVLNSRAIEIVGGDASLPAGADRGDDGRSTGLLWRSDDWLRGRVGPLPDLAPVGADLARLGITAVSDATPDLDSDALRHLAAAVAGGALPQRVTVMCDASDSMGLAVGPRKIVVTDHALPDPDALAGQIVQAHETGRAVAVHCVSQAALVLTIAALTTAGSRAGDRIEHCAEADASAVAAVAAAGVIVVTQPSLVLRRGDDYLDRHDESRHGDLWRYASLLAADVPTVASSDAPYGDADPWLSMRAAHRRQAASGRVLGPAERVSTETALAGYLRAPDDLRVGPRRVVIGGPADLVWLRRPLADVLREPSADLVAGCLVGGRPAYLASPG